jgi:hypothetical protein
VALETLDLDGTDDDKRIKGNTDGTLIGNVSDALKVDVVGSSLNTLTLPASFTFVASDIQIGNGKHMLSVANTGATPVFVRSVRLINSQTTAVTGIIAEFQLRRFTTHTAGTVVDGIASDTLDPLTGIEGRTGATISGLVTTPYRRSKWSTDEWGSGAQDVESNDHVLHTLIPWYQPSDNIRPIVLRQNQGITVQQLVNSTIGTFTVIIEVSR